MREFVYVDFDRLAGHFESRRNSQTCRCCESCRYSRNCSHFESRRNSEVRPDVITEEISVWMCPLNEGRGFVFSQESEGNDPRCRLVMTDVGKENGRKKPSTNVGPNVGRHCL